MTTTNNQAKQEYASLESYEAVLKETGTVYEEQKAFLKIPGPKGRVMYVGKGKNGVRRIDLSGFETADRVFMVPLKKKNGNVTGHLAIDGFDPSTQIENFCSALAFMKSLPDAEPKARSSRPSSPDSPPAPTVAPSQAALDLIRRVATEHGVPVSEASPASQPTPEQVAEEALDEEAELQALIDAAEAAAAASQES